MIYLSYVSIILSVYLIYLTLFTKWKISSESRVDKFLVFLVFFGPLLSSLTDVLTHFTTK